MPEPGDRLTLLEIQELLGNMEIQDDRPKLTSVLGAEPLTLRSPPDISWNVTERLLDQIQVCHIATTEQPPNTMCGSRLSSCEPHYQS
jgi:hypothetical protein